tara:strand:- start:200 stop:586 length:387 start_codon:yes stop_codon:yes gene_type:complete
MSTRAQVRFATREEGVSFSEHPEKINTQFYRHSDGYPEGLGIEIAESIIGGNNVAMEIENTNIKHGDLEYIYYIWQKPDDTTWISIFEVNFGDTYCEECGSYLQPQHTKDKCIFVGEPQKLIEKYDRE